MGYDDDKREYQCLMSDKIFGLTGRPPTMGKSDPVHSPTHYNRMGIECIDAIEASMSEEEFKGYLKGNVMKYMWRYRYKGKPLEDLKKAQWYLSKLIG